MENKKKQIYMIQTVRDVVREIKKDLEEKEEILEMNPETVFEIVIDILLLFTSYDMYLEFKNDIIKLVHEKQKSCSIDIDAEGIIDFCQRSAQLIHSSGEEINKAEARLRSLVEEDKGLFEEPVSIKSDDLQLLQRRISECIRKFLKECRDSFQQTMEKYGITAKLAEKYKNFGKLKEKIEKRRQELKSY